MVDFSIGEPYLENLGKNLELLQERVNDVEALRKKIKESDAINQAAFVLALDDVLSGQKQSIATKILIQFAMEACEKTGEYDYGLFKHKLTVAILNNCNNIFKVNKNDNSIKIDLLPLGQADQWIAAANAVRLRFQIGESRKARKPIGDQPAAYQFWMEKIYKPAREGQPVIDKKIKQSHLSPEMQRMGRLLKPKVSADQKAKYDKVIKARLAEFAFDKAPFWQLINYGNQTIGTGGKSMPYPLFGPTGFVDDAEAILTSLFRESIAIYRPKVEEALRKKRLEDFSGPSERSVEDEVRRKISMARIGITLGDEPLGKQTLSIVKAIEITYEIYASSLGNIFVRARGAKGRFIRSLLDIE